MADPITGILVPLGIGAGGLLLRMWHVHRQGQAELRKAAAETSQFAINAEEKERGEIYVRHKAELDIRDADLRRIREERDALRTEVQRHYMRGLELTAEVHQLRSASAADTIRIADMESELRKRTELLETYMETVRDLRDERNDYRRRLEGPTDDLKTKSTTDEVDLAKVQQAKRRAAKPPT